MHRTVLSTFVGGIQNSVSPCGAMSEPEGLIRALLHLPKFYGLFISFFMKQFSTVTNKDKKNDGEY
jgi:hypothetical protein